MCEYSVCYLNVKCTFEINVTTITIIKCLVGDLIESRVRQSRNKYSRAEKCRVELSGFAVLCLPSVQ